MERGVKVLVHSILDAWQVAVSGQHVVDEQRGPANGEYHNDCH